MCWAAENTPCKDTELQQSELTGGEREVQRWSASLEQEENEENHQAVYIKFYSTSCDPFFTNDVLDKLQDCFLST